VTTGVTGRTPNQHGQSIVVPLFTNKPTRLIKIYNKPFFSYLTSSDIHSIVTVVTISLVLHQYTGKN